MKIRKHTGYAALALALASVMPAQVMAADSLAVCAPGVPFAYPAGGANILWNPDQGGLGSLTNAQAITAVGAAFDQWENVPQSSATFLQGSTLAVDIDETNFGPIYTPATPNGESEIVFDEDGAIFTLLFGAGSGILGFAGPDFGNTITCELLEGSAFLNGPAFGDALEAEDIMVHEFGHYINLGHVELNGQLVSFSEGGDDSGATPDSTTFGAPSSFLGTEVIETMYPFYFGSSAVGTRTPHADDIASISALYPDGAYLTANTGSISGTIFAGNGTTPLAGVNVIARRLNAGGTGGDGDLSFTDAVSTFSGSAGEVGAAAGDYTLGNLTPGASYAVFVDEVTALAGRFSNTILQPLPGPEDYYDGAESSSEDPLIFAGVAVAAGSTAAGTDIIFNLAGEGDPLPVGDDDFVQLPLPFDFCIQGESHNSVFVNANGNLTFGAGDTDFSASNQEMLDGPPRIAGSWQDLNPSAGGSVYYNQTGDTFTVTWEDVPEWLSTGANTFAIQLKDNSAGYCPEVNVAPPPGPLVADITITYGDMTSVDGFAGFSGGLRTTNGVETEGDLSVLGNNGSRWIKTYRDAAIYENFDGGDNDLANNVVKFNYVGQPFRDRWESNNVLNKARRIETPFDTSDTLKTFSAIDPAAADIDFYRFEAQAGQYIIAETVRGQVDTVMGLWHCDDRPGQVRKCKPTTALFLAGNDDSNGLLSRIEGTLPFDGTYAIGVTFCCDYDFDGVDPGQGAPFDGGRYLLDIQVLDGLPLTLGDDTSINLSGFGFAIPYDGGSYTDIYVNSNGNITFGAGDPFGFIESIPAFEAGPPRAAAFWDDLNPTGALVLASTDFATELKISFVDVPEFLSTGANNFSVTLYSNGDVQYDYGSMTAVDGIVGTAQGGGAVSTPADLSGTGGGNVSASTVEQFTFGSPYDLPDPSSLLFNP